MRTALIILIAIALVIWAGLRLARYLDSIGAVTPEGGSTSLTESH